MKDNKVKGSKMRNQAQTARMAWMYRAFTVVALSGLLLAAGADWAAAATLRQLAGPGMGEMLVTVIFAVGIGLFVLLMRQGRTRRVAARAHRQDPRFRDPR